MRVNAEAIRPGLIRIDTENVAALTLTPASALRGNGDNVTVVWNGKSQETRAVDGVINLAQSNITSRTLRKRPELPGLLSDVINTPFAVVVGTTSTNAQMRKHCAQKADAFAQLWQQWQHQPLRFFKDTEISAADQEKYSLILIGGADSNAITRKLWKRIPLKVTADAVTIDGRRFVAKDAVVPDDLSEPVERAALRHGGCRDLGSGNVFLEAAGRAPGAWLCAPAVRLVDCGWPNPVRRSAG